MTEAEALIKMDALLVLLQSQEKSLTFNELLDLIKEKDASFNGKLLKIALYRLEDDNYVYELINEIDKTIKIYSITIQGAIFHGYKKQKEIDDLAFEIKGRAEKRAVLSDERLVFWTRFAGIAALLVFLWQVFLYLYPKQSDFYYFWWQTIPKK
jgi:hypothetical protein